MFGNKCNNALIGISYMHSASSVQSWFHFQPGKHHSHFSSHNCIGIQIFQNILSCFMILKCLSAGPCMHFSWEYLIPNSAIESPCLHKQALAWIYLFWYQFFTETHKTWTALVEKNQLETNWTLRTNPKRPRLFFWQVENLRVAAIL